MSSHFVSEAATTAKNEPFDVRILRQDRPGEPSHWQTFRLRREEGMNITTVLQRIAARPETIGGEKVAPVAFDANCLEEVCGSCTMLVNGRARQACSALVDRLLAEKPGFIELRPMTKFPVLRDLMVDRRRLFRALKKLECWIPVDSYADMGPGPRQSREQQERGYPLSQCMSCGCCLEACPKYKKIELQKRADESDEQFRERENRAFDHGFIGAHANGQAVRMNTHPTGAMTAARRLDTLIAPGGIQNCSKATNCQAVCPKEIPLMEAWGRAGRSATLHVIKNFFDGN